ncbi:MAG: 30S ribosome-binding factor RbfA [Clostridia bacterium]|nr:30S ribosome-binding factor RbfA [Clostridia bacterium]
MAKIKADKITEEFRRVISEIITNEINDERVHGKCTVMSVNVTPDLAYCKVGVSVLGDDKAKQKAIDGLSHAKGYIKKRLSDIISVRKIPELTFVLDNSIDYSIKISQIIDDLK